MTAAQVGGGIRTLTYSGQQVLDGYPADEMCHDGRGQILMPWPNRIAGGRYTFGGTTYQLPLTEPSFGHAIHGLVRWKSWRGEPDRASGSVTLAYTLFPEPGFPFTLDLSVTYTLTADGLQTEMQATNIGSQPCPFGAGQHPYILPFADHVDDAILRVPAAAMYRSDERSIPVEKVRVAGTDLDFRTARAIGSTRLNTDFTDLQRDETGRATITVAGPDGSLTSVWTDRAFRHVMIYTGDTVIPRDRRRRSLAVEPMSCPPNAFNSGEDLVILAPGDAWTGRWGISRSR
jgi:aldose 1-epimerase